MMYKSVKLYSDPEEKMNENDLSYSEMTSFQRSFLSGLIKEKEPQKIVEIGVSAGGTTALIIQCLKMLGIKAEMYSVDLMEKWYRNNNFETGFIAKKYLEGLSGNIIHRFLLGNSIPFCLKQIGENIDFLILDTAHRLPGEYLDFIVCLPFLKEGAIVVMHDAIENHLTCKDGEIATKLLFDTVTANDKYYMWEEDINIGGLPNIAAFKVGKETKDNIRDLFSMMTVSWGYILNDKERKKYQEFIQENYGEEYLNFFDRIETLQRNTYLQKMITNHYGKNAEYLKMKWKSQNKVILYGAGYFAGIYYNWAKLNQLRIDGLVISDGQDKTYSENIDVPIYFFSEMPYTSNECAIVLAIGDVYQSLILQNLQKYGYNNIL